MIVTIAATALSLIKPLIDTITTWGSHSVLVLTRAPGDDDAPPIEVWDQYQRGAPKLARIRKVLLTILFASGIAATATAALAVIVEATFDSFQSDLAVKLRQIRSAGRDIDGSLASAKRTLERRKNESPFAVMVLEALAEILPDHTYVTELRIEANKVRVIGVTRDAPSLIELIEKSGRFSHASFLGPTTRSASDPGERFNIEAVIQPIASVRS
jgi:general secretion pathway protein L